MLISTLHANSSFKNIGYISFTMYELLLLYLLCAVGPLNAFREEFRFASYYGDHMVLQKAPEQSVLWGYGSDGAEVIVSLKGEQENRKHSVLVQNGIWRVALEPMKAGGPYNVTAVQQGTANAQVTLMDVLFGDVWLCSGQSNMAYTLSQVFNASEEQAMAPQFPHVRIFMAALERSNTELLDLPRVEVPWSIPSAAELLGGPEFTYFSAVCWLFGRYLYKTLGYPVGLVESCWGGTPVEAWSSHRVLQKCGLESQDLRHPCFTPYETMPGLMVAWSNSVLWNAMIHPLLNMTIKGAIWYQGEANTEYHQDKYICAFPAMIDDWRISFHKGSGGQTAPDFPFGFVQLSTSHKGSMSDGFPNLRWHQTAGYGYVPNLRMKRTFMAVALDLPDEESPWGSIHPRNKQDVAYRLTLGARAVAYGDKGVSFQGPFPVKVLLKGDSINITYTKSVSVTRSKTIFEICCTKAKNNCSSNEGWVPAPIMHWGLSYIQVSAVQCRNTVSGVRYAWKDWPCDIKACPVYSADRVLPAPPFIVNRWP
ncbi:sialate O-acetylesterase-like isoform X3 [Megalops cyprinoides]|uniref:sialate O-acetylesterase-like isoform X3 n=1 Tax=Megalops cyprinoides TaxID=118141 RepID=UPI0018641317|nr:sialate O-acetylesterase-like isoform X3 [Megalops cyprinoides]